MNRKAARVLSPDGLRKREVVGKVPEGEGE
jgi:hypothetical protein